MSRRGIRSGRSSAQPESTLANALILLTFALIALILLFYQRERPAERVFSADGYTEAVEKYIIPYLQYNPEPKEGERVVELSQIGDVPDIVWKFFQNSYLRSDINANDPKLWDIRDSNVKGIDPNAHNVLLPIRSPARWEGEISFKTDDTAVGEIVGNGVALQRIILRPIRSEDSGSLKRESVRASNTAWENEVVEAHKVSLTNNNYSEIAQLFVLGDQIVIRVSKASEAKISIDGSLIGGSGVDYRSIPAGAEILIDDPSGVPAVFTSRGVRGATNTLSGYRALIGRSFDPRLQNFSRALVGDMNRLMGALHNGLSDDDTTALKSLDVAVTLRPDLNQKLQEELESKVSELSGVMKASGYDQPIPAAITVIDALAGDVLAIASTPDPDELSNTARASLRINQNFVNHPIGSVAKPIVSAAILETWPALADLKVRNPDLVEGKHTVTNILGFELELGTVGNGVNLWITYEDYIARSSNVYAAFLMVLAMTENPVGATSTQEPIIRDYVIQRFRPSNDYNQAPTRSPKPHFDKNGYFSYNLKFEWVRELKGLYQIEVENNALDPLPTIKNDPFWQKSIWNELLKEIEGLESGLLDRQSGALRQISPETVNLKVNQAQHIRSDLINLILGGGESRWTTIKVAEAYSRLVTGRRVVASLIDKSNETEARFPSMTESCQGTGDPIYGRRSDRNFCPKTREISLRGMYDVAREVGTAKSMRAKIDEITNRIGDNQFVCVFAKTGTPQIERIYQRRIDRVVTALGESNRQHLRYSEDQIDGRSVNQVDIVLSSGERIRHNTPNFETVATRAIRSDPRMIQHLEYAGVTPNYLARYINRYNRDSPDSRSEYFSASDDGNRVRGRPPRTDTQSKYWGKAFAYVAVTYPKMAESLSNEDFCRDHAFQSEPTKAFAVAINLPVPVPGEGPDPKFAIDLGSYALEMLEEQLK